MMRPTGGVSGEAGRARALFGLVAVLITLGLLISLPVAATGATISFTNNDGAGEGFNDPTVVSPIGGNPGTTLGEQRRNAFQRALNIWGSTLNSSVTITVGATFNPMGGTSTSAILGSCGPNRVYRDFTGAPRGATWYVSALASALTGTDMAGVTDDMTGQFNSDVDNATVLGGTDWYYGYDGNPGSDVDFIKVVLHEVGHGVGFLSLVDLTTGAKSSGYDDAYMVFLENHSTGKLYPAMTDAERVTAAKNTGNLHWTGPNVVGYSGNYTAGVDAANGHVRMYAPNPVEGGSSVSHFDTVLSPNETMEPSHKSDSTWDLTLMLLKDLGWTWTPLAITSVAPSVGPTAGGTTVTITGTNLTGTTSVKFGGTSATSVSVVNSTTVTCVTPAKAAGTYDVLLTTSCSRTTRTGGYTYSDLPVVTITASDATATEAGPTTGQFTVSRTGSTASPLTVNYTVGGTATSASDYNSIGTSVIIGAGSATGTITVTPIDDSEIEADETAVATLSAGGSYTVGSPSSATVTITSDDLPTVTISATDATATEAGTTTGTFTVTRTGSTAASLTVNYTVGGTATSGSDYTSIGTSVTIGVGSATGTITVTPVNDSGVEADETVIATLSANPAYVIGSPSSATVTITSDDLPVVTITANDATATEAGPTTGQFTVSRTGSTSSALTVNYTVGGTATSGSDYTSIGTSVTIGVGSATGTITVTPVNDSGVEADETVIATLSANAAYAIGSPSSATVTITSDDLPTVTVSATDATATEAGTTTGTFTVTRTGPTTGSLTVNYTVGGTATTGSDYTSIGTSVTIGVGSATGTITVTPINDTDAEADETVIVTLSANAAYAIGSPSSATVTITSDDLPMVTISATDATATEAGTTTGQFTVSRTGSTASPLTVDYAVSGTATSGSDYNSIGTSVTIGVGSATGTITVTPIDDSEIEPDETVVATLSAGGSYTVGSPSSATVTITSDDLPTVTISATDATATEAGTTTGTFTVTRTGSTAASLTVNYTVGGTATSGSDYTSIGTSVTIGVGSATGTIMVTPVNDSGVEADETVIATLSANSAYVIGSPSSATVTITSDDLPVVTITASDATATEAGETTGQFTVSRTGPTTSSLSVYFTVSGTATSGEDYLSIGTSVTIGVGSATATMTVTPIDDAEVEGSETVIATISANAAYAIGSPTSATVTIADDESAASSFANIATRGKVLTGSDIMIGGITVSGMSPTQFIFRGLGPSLTAYGVPGALANPVIRVFSGQTMIATNDDWGSLGTSDKAILTAEGLIPKHARDSALVLTLDPGPYTLHLLGVNKGTGVGLVEVYETSLWGPVSAPGEGSAPEGEPLPFMLQGYRKGSGVREVEFIEQPSSPAAVTSSDDPLAAASATDGLSNIATRGKVLTGADVMIAGFTLMGGDPKTVVIRGIGPSLTAYGVPGALANPTLQVYSGSTVIATNDNWGSLNTTDKGVLTSLSLTPTHSLEAAVVLTLPPGPYTAILSGVNKGTGVGLIEVYDADKWGN